MTNHPIPTTVRKLKTLPTIVPDMPEEEYHARPEVRAQELKS